MVIWSIDAGDLRSFFHNRCCEHISRHVYLTNIVLMLENLPYTHPAIDFIFLKFRQKENEDSTPTFGDNRQVVLMHALLC